MTSKDFQKLCKSGDLHGAYLFFGEEEYVKNRCLHMARAAIFGESEDDPFNRVMICCETERDTSFLETLAGEVYSLPMFGEKKLIELHGVNYNKLGDDDLDRLLALLREQKQSEDSALILYAENAEFDAGQLPKKPSALFKSFDAVIPTVSFFYETPAALNGWVIRHFAASGVTCSSFTAAKIIDYCSKDMFSLANETDKLICFTLAAGKNTVDESDIERVCCGKSIDGSFAFTDALMRGDGTAATRLLSHMKADRERPESILGGVIDTLGNMYTVKLLRDEGLTLDEIKQKTGLHEYRVKNYAAAVLNKKTARLEGALRLCMEADMKIKVSSLDDYTVLDRLVVRLCRV